MNLRQSSKLALLISVAVSAYIGNYSLELRGLMNQKLEEQKTALNDFQEWKQEYERLIPLNEKWEKSFNSFDEIRDLLQLHSFLGSKPFSQPESLVVSKIEEIKFQDIHIGAYKVCMTSLEGAGYVFKDSSFDNLMNDIKVLNDRADILLGRVSFKRINPNSAAMAKSSPEDKENSPKAILEVSPLCLIFKG